MFSHRNLAPKTNMIFQKALNTIFRLYDNCKASEQGKTEYSNGGSNLYFICS